MEIQILELENLEIIVSNPLILQVKSLTLSIQSEKTC